MLSFVSLLTRWSIDSASFSIGNLFRCAGHNKSHSYDKTPPIRLKCSSSLNVNIRTACCSRTVLGRALELQKQTVQTIGNDGAQLFFHFLAPFGGCLELDVFANQSQRATPDKGDQRAAALWQSQTIPRSGNQRIAFAGTDQFSG